MHIPLEQRVLKMLFSDSSSLEAKVLQYQDLNFQSLRGRKGNSILNIS